MKKKIVTSLVLALSVASILTGCGGGSKYYGSSTDNAVSSNTSSGGGYYEDYYDGYYDDYYYDSDYDYSYDGSGEFGADNVDVSESASQSQTVDTSRKLIKTVNMEVETLEYDNLLYAITDQVNVCGGYIENSYTNNGSVYSYYKNNKYGTMTIRIPADRLDEFLNSFSPLCNVLNKSEGVEDVTLTYVDLESRKNALLIEEQRLLELLETAEYLEDMLTIESRLTDIRYQLESMESQLRTYDNKINYSTVYLSINEVKEITPEPEPEPETAWQRISEGFMKSLQSLGHGLSEFGIWFVVKLPFLLLWALIIFAHVMIIRGIIRFNVKKNRKRREEAKKAQLHAMGIDVDAQQNNPYEITVDSNEKATVINQENSANTSVNASENAEVTTEDNKQTTADNKQNTETSEIVNEETKETNA